MEDGKQLWSIWQRLLTWFGAAFTRPGWVRFAQWVSGTVLCDEQHTITQEVTSLNLIDQWRNWNILPNTVRSTNGPWNMRR